jgi:hypothetical protein
MVSAEEWQEKERRTNRSWESQRKKNLPMTTLPAAMVW